MSSEITRTGSRAAPRTAKAATGESPNRDMDSSHSGGVSEDGTTGRVGKLSWEISGCEPSGVQPLDQGPKAEAGRAAGEVGVPRSSDDPPESKSGGERRGGTWVKARQSSEGPGDGREDEVARLFDRIATPVKVQKLQRALYRKAKAEPAYRFYSLYGELLRPDLIDTAMGMVAHNDGAAGIDGQDCSVLVNDETREVWKAQLLEELRTKQYRPGPVLRVYVPKDDGKQRPLGIPTVKDRVVQAAVAILMLPILEADSHPNSYAYRPKRGAHQAMKAIGAAVVQGRWEVMDADLSGYFDSIPHRALLRIVSRRISDGMILKLVRGWLKAPIVERNPKTGKRTQKDNDQGTPQGGVISPLLANAYLNRLDWEVNERCAGKPVMVRYADDFVILARKGQGPQLLERLKRWLTHRGLKLNETKTRLVDLRREGIKFLGFEIMGRQATHSKKWYPHVEPHPKSLKKLRDKIREKLNRGTLGRGLEEVIPELNRQLKGWSHYFHYGNSTQAFGQVNRYVVGRLSRWWWRKHGCRRGQWNQLTVEVLQERYQLFRLPQTAAWRCR